MNILRIYYTRFKIEIENLFNTLHVIQNILYRPKLQFETTAKECVDKHPDKCNKIRSKIQCHKYWPKNNCKLTCNKCEGKSKRKY